MSPEEKQPSVRHIFPRSLGKCALLLLLLLWVSSPRRSAEAFMLQWWAWTTIREHVIAQHYMCLHATHMLHDYAVIHMLLRVAMWLIVVAAFLFAVVVFNLFAAADCVLIRA